MTDHRAALCGDKGEAVLAGEILRQCFEESYDSRPVFAEGGEMHGTHGLSVALALFANVHPSHARPEAAGNSRYRSFRVNGPVAPQELCEAMMRTLGDGQL